MTKKLSKCIVLNLVASLMLTISFMDTSEMQSQVNKVGNINGNMNNRGYVASQGDWIYFHNRYDDFNLYKMKLNVSGLVKLSDGLATAINVLGDWVYYSEGTDSKIYKIKTDGTKKTKLSDDKDVGSLMVVGD